MPDCQKHPICKDTPNGLVFIEKSCVRYWLCVGGYPRLQRCAAGLAVNPTSLKCELASTVPGCEPPPTTTPAEEESTEAPGGANQGQGQQGANNNQQQGGGGGGGQAANQQEGGAQSSRPLQFSNPFRPSGQQQQGQQQGGNNGRLVG